MQNNLSKKSKNWQKKMKEPISSYEFKKIQNRSEIKAILRDDAAINEKIRPYGIHNW